MAFVDYITELKDLAEKQSQCFDCNEFFRVLMTTFGTAKSTVNMALDPDNTAQNVAPKIQNDNMLRRDIAIKKRIYMRFVADNSDLLKELDDIKECPTLHNKKYDIPLIVIVSKSTIVIYDVKEEDLEIAELKYFYNYYSIFLPMTGKYTKDTISSEHPADVKACTKLTRLLETLIDRNNLKAQDQHKINVFICRVLFCLFAEDTGIFDKNIFTNTFLKLTKVDGSDCDSFFTKLFKTLDTPHSHRGGGRAYRVNF